MTRTWTDVCGDFSTAILKWRRVTEQGWSGKKNGDLLRAADREFDVLVTMDRNMQYQQTLSAYDLAVVLILARSNRRRDVEPAMPEVNRILREVQSGELRIVSV